MTLLPRLVRGGQPLPACTLVIFGASGDLARRKLLPALYSLHCDGHLPPHFIVLGCGRTPLRDDAFRAAMREGCEAHARHPVTAAGWDDFAPRLRYVATDVGNLAAESALPAALADLGDDCGRLFYLSLPPSVYPAVLTGLGAAGLVSRERRQPFTRVVVEKPFGHDLASAVELNATALSVLREGQIYRIDHYLGKEAVQNILVFRFGNAIFEPLWNRKYIDHVQITAAESIGVEGRGGFYEQAGVLRDIVQNHLLQVLSLVAMEPPTSFEADAIRDQKAQVLRCLQPPGQGDLRRQIVRGQYGPGEVDGRSLPGYRQEAGVAPDSPVPTFVALKLGIENWRWQGVPFYLRAGKRLAKRVTEVSIFFQHVPLHLFGAASPEANVLTFRIQPDEGISLRFGVKVPGEAMRVADEVMDFRYRGTFGEEPPEAYERLLLEAMQGDPTLFARADEVEAAWRFITPILQAWEGSPPPEFPNYFPGRWGPPEAEALISRDGRAWRNP